MSMLQQVMAMAQSARGGSKSSADDVVGKENRAAYRRMIENAVKPDSGYSQEQIAALTKNAPKGVDPTLYTTIAGMKSPAQIEQQKFDSNISSQFAQLMNGGKPVQQATPTPSMPIPSTGTQPTPQAAPTQPSPPSNIFTDDFVVRATLKKLSGIDVGGHYLEGPKWFESYGNRVNSGTPASQAMTETAIEYGFVPSGASNLKELSEPERKVIFERELSTALNDPTLDAIVQKIIPSGTNVKKAKLGMVLSAFTENNLYIPDHYQPFLDRYRGLEDPTFVDDNIKTHIYQTTGKLPSEINSSDVAKATKQMQNDALIQTMAEAYWRKKGTTKAEFELEILKPISAEDRAEQGINSQIKTYQQLADEGRRFASDADRKMYQELYTARERFVGMRNLFFGTKDDPSSGIFIGIENAGTARLAARGKHLWEKVKGSQKGRNIEEFNDYKAYFARSLIKIAGESGSRLSDQDISGIVPVMPDTGTGLTGVPDSEALARSKFDRSVAGMEKLMKLLESTTTIGQPTAAPIEEYEIDKIYTDANGRKAKYIGGEKPWQIQP